MKKFACGDVVAGCDGVVTGETEDPFEPPLIALTNVISQAEDPEARNPEGVGLRELVVVGVPRRWTGEYPRRPDRAARVELPRIVLEAITKLATERAGVRVADDALGLGDHA